MVFESPVFALKGGTGINLFWNNLPRISVDLDVVYTDPEPTRDVAIAEITEELRKICYMFEHQLGIGAHWPESDEVKCVAIRGDTQVKIEVNPVFRGTLLDVEFLPLCPKAFSDFPMSSGMIPVLARDEIYASKLVAALARQHPRDLFDMKMLADNGGISEIMLDCFTLYLATSSKPFHEVLFGHDHDLSDEYRTAFRGMSDIKCSIADMNQTRVALRAELKARLPGRRLNFLNLSFLGARTGICSLSRLSRIYLQSVGSFSMSAN